MANYTGSKCEYCKKIFTDSDDIVVCPECGTPYHRECYLEAGECINTELHERGEDWQTFYGDRVDISDNADNKEENGEEGVGDNELKCPRCGVNNPPSGLFCVNCGMPLNKNQEARPFNNPGSNTYGNNQGGQAFGGQPFQNQTINLITEEIDGIKGEKLVKYVKKNPIYYIANFFGFSRNNSKGSINISAILFPEYFFFYRKMYGIGVFMLLLATLLEIPTLILYMLDGTIAPGVALPSLITNNVELIKRVGMICSFVRMTSCIICGIFANYWYFKKAKKDITQVEQMSIPEEEKDEILNKKGGTSGLSLGFSITANVAMLLLIIIALVYFSG